MNFAKILKLGLALIFTYKFGELVGKVKGFHEFVDQNDDLVFANGDMAKYEIHHGFIAYKTKPKEPEEGDK